MTTPDRPADNRRPPLAAIVVMGVSGSGKSTIGAGLAQRLGYAFVDADDLHPAANIARMHAGIPLTDADRAPWLAAVRQRIDAARGSGQPIVIACSALKQSYRTSIGADAHDVRTVWLTGAPALIRSRLAARRGHFMPAALLNSQFAALEPPADDDDVKGFDIAATPEAIVANILAWLAGAASNVAPPPSHRERAP